MKHHCDITTEKNFKFTGKSTDLNSQPASYSNVPKDDQKTQMFKSLNLNWRDIYGVPTEQVAQMIRDDEIDILVELTGHTANNRLDITAMKPAPIQITYFNDFVAIY